MRSSPSSLHIDQLWGRWSWFTIYEGTKYKMQTTRSGPNSYFLALNGSYKELEMHRLMPMDRFSFLSMEPVTKPAWRRRRIVTGLSLAIRLVFSKKKTTPQSFARLPLANFLGLWLRKAEEGGHVQVSKLVWLMRHHQGETNFYLINTGRPAKRMRRLRSWKWWWRSLLPSLLCLAYITTSALEQF
jgi:hypothetical protein